ncbi:MAG: hypothetical protein ABIN25_09240 [Ginsengibacter sp.]
MKAKSESTPLRFTRCVAMGVILSMLLFYSAHVFGTWAVEEYFPRPETTGTILLHNTCVVLGNTHTLRPNTDVSGLGAGIDGTKLSASLMNFLDGHIIGIIILALLLGTIIFFIRTGIKRNVPSAIYSSYQPVE